MDMILTQDFCYQIIPHCFTKYNNAQHKWRPIDLLSTCNITLLYKGFLTIKVFLGIDEELVSMVLKVLLISE